jgi:hypothetical protein
MYLTWSKLKMRKQNTTEVNSLSEFIHQLETRIEDRYRILLFRGQNTNKALIPKIARHYFKKSREVDEKRMLREFIINAKPQLQTKLETKLDKLVVAQHYGIPTRLLDWTENPLTALYFATNRVNEDADHSVVWVISFDRSSSLLLDNPNVDPFNINTIKFYRPENLIERLSAQNGWLSIHPQNGYGFYQRAEKIDDVSAKMSKIIIPKKRLSEIHQTLNSCGINEFSIFQDLDSLGKYVFKKYKKQLRQ